MPCLAYLLPKNLLFQQVLACECCLEARPKASSIAAGEAVLFGAKARSGYVEADE